VLDLAGSALPYVRDDRLAKRPRARDPGARLPQPARRRHRYWRQNSRSGSSSCRCTPQANRWRPQAVPRSAIPKRRCPVLASVDSSSKVSRWISRVANFASLSKRATWRLRELCRLLLLPWANNTTARAPAGRLRLPSSRAGPAGTRTNRSSIAPADFAIWHALLLGCDRRCKPKLRHPHSPSWSLATPPFGSHREGECLRHLAGF
jgi:hypothetical protein